ncbi:MAG: hypothetical protein M1814_000879 [Vezdaea aestivalis]|nr:MAG: hypothetical protein M1814_000879 [Vezdaea aestivalis]
MLTLKPSGLHNPIGPGASLSSVHDYPPTQHFSSASLYTPAATPVSSSSPPQIHPGAHSHHPLPASPPPQVGMSNPHPISLPPPRGLPQPSPQPSNQLSSGPSNNTLAPLPPAPGGWGERSDDGMRNWLSAKAEEDKRKQEEEKTKQELHRLEQRKVEAGMLHESLERGVPPPMVPIIFAGMGGANVSVDMALHWSQHYLEMQRQQQELHAIELQRQNHASQVLGTNPYASMPLPAPPQPPTQLQGRPPPSQAGPLPPFSAQTSRPRGDTGPLNPTSNPRPDQSLQRLNTSEMTPVQHQRPPPPAILAGPPSQALHPLQQSQAPQGSEQPPQGPQQPQQQQGQGPPQQQGQQSSPNIFFYWQPPSTQANQPTTPQESPHSHSPKRRKIAGLPSSTSQAAQVSPQYRPASAESTPGQRRGGSHSRNRSESSSIKGPSDSQQQTSSAAGRQAMDSGVSGSGGPHQQHLHQSSSQAQSTTSSEDKTPKLAEAVPTLDGRRRSDARASADADPLLNREPRQERELARRTPTRKRESSRD